MVTKYVKKYIKSNYDILNNAWNYRTDMYEPTLCDWIINRAEPKLLSQWQVCFTKTVNQATDTWVVQIVGTCTCNG